MTVSRGPRVIAAEVSLVGVSLAVAYGATRLFDGTDWVWPVLATVVVVHGISAIARRNRAGIPVQVALVVLTEAVMLAVIFAGDTFNYVLPTADTLSLLETSLQDAIDAYPTARAPVVPADGFVLAFCIGLSVVALMADIAAFSLRAPLQALIPPFTLFVLCTLLGSGDAQLTSALAFLVAALAFLLTVRGLEQATTTTWMPGDQERGPNALLRLGGLLIGLAAVAAFVVGPAIPGAADDALWTWRGGGGPGTRVVVSPLVDLRARLVNQSQDIYFVVDAEQASYWRLGALDQFDGTEWTMSDDFRDVSGDFINVRANDPRPEVTQQVQIRQLGGEYLPAAYQVTGVEGLDTEITFNDQSSTLLVPKDYLRNGLSYEVTSRVPSFTAEQLRAADDDLPEATRRRYLELPELDDRVYDLAETVTAGAETDYDKAFALQSFFRSDEFEYSTDIDGSDDDALEYFLFEERAGYCEQFAASYAALARSVGLPTRVAVGFTQGDESANRPGLYTVRGENAHAWPEVYFRDIGWVPFEPTPGVSPTGAEAWTGLSGDPEDAAAQEDPLTETDVPIEPTIPPDLELQLPDFDAGATGGAASQSDDTTIPVPLRVALAVLVVVGGWFALIIGLAGARRARRRHHVHADPTGRVELAWTEAVEALARRGKVPRDSETRTEYAARVTPSSPTVAEPLHSLAVASAAARYSNTTPDDSEVERAIELSASIVSASTHHLPWYRRALVAGDPRRLVSQRPRRARRTATVVSTA